MELRHLRYFIAIAEDMSFRQAAEKLSMTQPPLSQQIQQLEAELGFELFHRKGRSIELTSAGQVFLVEAQHILNLVERAVKRAEQAARGETGELAIGFVETAAYHLLPRILRAFTEQYPQVQIRLSRMTSNEQLGALEDGHIDVAFCRVPTSELPDGVTATMLLWESLCAVLPEKHPLAQKSDLQVKDLADERFIMFPQHPGEALFQKITKACQRAGFTMNITQEATQMITIVGLVAAGLGVSLLPASVMEVPLSGVHYRVMSQAGTVPLSMVWREAKVSEALQNFLDISRSTR